MSVQVLSLWRGVITSVYGPPSEEDLALNLPPRSMARIVEEVAERHGLKVSDLRGRSTAHAIAHPRQEAMHLMMVAGFTTTQIASRLGNRDHSTVSHGHRAHKRRAGIA